MMTAGEIHSFNIDSGGVDTGKDSATLAQSSVPMETAAKKSRAGRDMEGQRRKSWAGSPRVRRVAGDQS